MLNAVCTLYHSNLSVLGKAIKKTVGSILERGTALGRLLGR